MNRSDVGVLLPLIKKHLKFLSDLGPRPCGSKNLSTAFDYFYDQLESLNPRSLDFQRFNVKAFRRGACEIRLISPVEKKLNALSFGFCANARYDRAEIIYPYRGLPEDFEAAAARIKGKVALTQTVTGHHRSSVIKLAQKYGAIGLLMISNLPDGYAQTGYASQNPRLAKIFGAGIDAAGGKLLTDMIEKGVNPELKINIGNEYFPALGQNLIADFGKSRTSHYLFSAHLDSWDISPSISDNGSGVATVMAIAYVLSQYDISFRVALFDAEEIGLKGSKNYVSHNDLSQIKAVVNFDIVGLPKSIAVIGEIPDLVDAAPVKSPSANKDIRVFPSSPGKLKYVSDFIPFIKKSVPALITISERENGRRGRYYHSRHDTLANFKPDDLIEWAYIMEKLLVI